MANNAKSMERMTKDDEDTTEVVRGNPKGTRKDREVSRIFGY